MLVSSKAMYADKTNSSIILQSRQSNRVPVVQQGPSYKNFMDPNRHDESEAISLKTTKAKKSIFKYLFSTKSTENVINAGTSSPEENADTITPSALTVYKSPHIPKHMHIEVQERYCFSTTRDNEIEGLCRKKLTITSSHNTAEANLLREDFIKELKDALRNFHLNKKTFVTKCLEIEKGYSDELRQLNNFIRDNCRHTDISKDFFSSSFTPERNTNPSSPLINNSPEVYNSPVLEKDPNDQKREKRLGKEKESESLMDAFGEETDRSHNREILSKVAKNAVLDKEFNLIRTQLINAPEYIQNRLLIIEETVSKLVLENRRLRDELVYEREISMKKLQMTSIPTTPTSPIHVSSKSNISLVRHSVGKSQIEAQLIDKQSELMETINSFNTIKKNMEARMELIQEELDTEKEKLKMAETRERNLRGEVNTLKLELKKVLSEKEKLRMERDRLDDMARNAKELAVVGNDMNSKLEFLESQLQQERASRSRAEMKQKEQKDNMITKLNGLTARNDSLRTENQNLEDRLKELAVKASQPSSVECNIRLSAESLATRVSELTNALDTERQQAVKWRQDFEQKHEEAADLRLEVQKLQGSAAQVSMRLWEEERQRKDDEILALQERIKQQKYSFESATERWTHQFQEMQAELRIGEEKRRKMHNEIQELKGNIRVFARIRPFQPNDASAWDEQPCILPKADECSLEIKPDNGPGVVGSERHRDRAPQGFTFDHVFHQSSTQSEVFEEVRSFVQSALDGFNVCLFSYGQTGSGKTHTMQGASNGEGRGIIPRAMEHLGQYKMQQEQGGWYFIFEVSYLEIYNEKIQDLLAPPGDERPHEIRQTQAGGVEVTDLVTELLDPNDSAKVNRLIEKATRNRAVGKTDMNERSSRSHSVFSVKIRATHETDRLELRGSLDLVDLAGSERLDKSNAVGDRQKETRAINTSLTHLTTIFSAIASKQKHIPFRNSQLTYLLQPALSGNGKTMMMINLSPSRYSYQESLNTLRFAASVSQLELGRARKHIGEIKSGTNSSSFINNSKQKSRDEYSLNDDNLENISVVSGLSDQKSERSERSNRSVTTSISQTSQSFQNPKILSQKSISNTISTTSKKAQPQPGLNSSNNSIQIRQAIETSTLATPKSIRPVAGNGIMSISRLNNGNTTSNNNTNILSNSITKKSTPPDNRTSTPINDNDSITTPNNNGSNSKKNKSLTAVTRAALGFSSSK